MNMFRSSLVLKASTAGRSVLSYSGPSRNSVGWTRAEVRRWRTIRHSRLRSLRRMVGKVVNLHIRPDCDFEGDLNKNSRETNSYSEKVNGYV
ncbi:hypothetical protein AcV7_001629 [Taiwanofungus camphoratus]|nr:hypothetical protein AcV7_001629 [Antrodia cinnamomea]